MKTPLSCSVCSLQPEDGLISRWLRLGSRPVVTMRCSARPGEVQGLFWRLQQEEAFAGEKPGRTRLWPTPGNSQTEAAQGSELHCLWGEEAEPSEAAGTSLFLGLCLAPPYTALSTFVPRTPGLTDEYEHAKHSDLLEVLQVSHPWHRLKADGASFHAGTLPGNQKPERAGPRGPPGKGPQVPRGRRDTHRGNCTR